MRLLANSDQPGGKYSDYKEEITANTKPAIDVADEVKLVQRRVNTLVNIPLKK